VHSTRPARPRSLAAMEEYGISTYRPDDLVNDRLMQIKFDIVGLEEKIRFRDKWIRPGIIFTLVGIGLVALGFLVLSGVRLYEHVDDARLTTICYTVIMGVLIALYMCIDYAYYTGLVGLPHPDELPRAVFQILHDNESFFYIRPYQYYDDRVPRNVAGVWSMRVCIPLYYALAITAYWGADDGRSRAAVNTPDGIEFLGANILGGAFNFMMCTVVAANVFKCYIPWDVVPPFGVRRAAKDAK
jgi:hypothetical protein